MTHACYLCGEGRPDRAVWHGAAGTASRVHIPRRFEGPEGMVNGGIALATLGCATLHAAGEPDLAIYRLTGRLERPAPFDEDLEAVVEPTADRAWQARLASGDRTFASARIELGSADGASWAPLPDHLRTALARMSDHVEAAPTGPLFAELQRERLGLRMTCFGCCRSRDDGGLYLPAQLAAPRVAWSALDVAHEFDEGDGRLAQAIGAAATDCATGMSLETIEGFWDDLDRENLVALTGALDYRWLRPTPLEGPAYRVLSTPNGVDGRKMYGIAGLFDTTGQLYVLSEGTWLTVPNPHR